jgi:hypothetical protein
MPDPNLDATVAAIVKQSPSRVLEAYYWSQESGLLEFIRSFLRLPVETREALKALLPASVDPQTVQAVRDEQGRLTLSLASARDAANIMIGAREPATQTVSPRHCAIA